MDAQIEFPSRAQQLDILQRLKAQYPGLVDVQGWEHPHLTSELLYLRDHGLVTVELSQDLSLIKPQAIFASLTAKGIDFLQGDGGLSAILGVVTVKLHEDTIKSLVQEKIMDSELSAPEKKRYLDALRNLPAESTTHLAKKLIDAGLANVPVAWNAIQNVLSAAL